jgi:hypothetical protein
MLPVLTVPAEATIARGVSPALRSRRMARSSSSGSMRKLASTGTRRTASVPRPRSAAALRIDMWTSAEA